MATLPTHLIAQLEAATEPSLDLNFAIAEWLDPERIEVTTAKDFRRLHGRLPYVGMTWLHDFTGNVQDALSLLPEGCDFLLARGRLAADEKQYGAALYSPDSVDGGVPPADREIGVAEHEVGLAFAICIAGIRARAGA